MSPQWDFDNIALPTPHDVRRYVDRMTATRCHLHPWVALETTLDVCPECDSSAAKGDPGQ